ncbi:ABC transporter ATP-binding protein [Nitrogeniibacter mangrovi]|nr:ABC transporter ATP-binding protein [Nitrogeniibacter mangrovi]
MPDNAKSLVVEELVVEIAGERPVRPVDSLSFEVAAGQTMALLGESGCGKSMTALAMMRLLPTAGRICAGRVRLGELDVLAQSEAQMRAVRGGRLGMIFQEPSTSLNPVMTVFAQIGEVLSRHRALSGEAARKEAARLLAAVGIPDPQARLDDYPFQFSGGMKQRVMIAMALAGEPDMLIADEPTTALDVTLQAQVLDLLLRLQRERGMGIMLITHDLGVVARMAHQVGVMYAGQLVETGPRDAFFATPLHPYSRKLFAAVPSADRRGGALETLPGIVPPLDRAFAGCRFAERCPVVMSHCASVEPQWHVRDGQRVRCHLYADGGAVCEDTPSVSAAASTSSRECDEAPAGGRLEVDGLRVHFPVRKGVFKRVVGQVKAVDGVSLKLQPGKTLALVGESGCGKTTAGKAILQLIEPTAGKVQLDGATQNGRRGRALRALRRQVQMVFQDPFASLNPRMRVGDIIAEGMKALGVSGEAGARHAQIDRLLERVGLSPAMRERFPHEFSGGQRQRIALARALAVSPRVIICDEPTSALDVSVQAQILNLMRDLQRAEGIAYLFITHNIAVVDFLAHEVAVMYLGRIVEYGSTESVLRQPRHPYTRMLLDAVLTTEADGPDTVGDVPDAPGELPSPLNPPDGCHFHPRCALADARCRSGYPGPTFLGAGGYVHCFRVSEAETGA